MKARQPLPSKCRPIPKFVCDDPAFAALLGIYTSSLPDDMDLHSRWQSHKLILRTVGHKARNSILNRSGNTNPAHEAQIMSTIARFIWLGDCKGASRLAETSPFAASLLEVFPNSASLKDPMVFSDRLADLKLFLLIINSVRIRKPTSPPPGPPAARVLSFLWLLRNKNLTNLRFLDWLCFGLLLIRGLSLME